MSDEKEVSKEKKEITVDAPVTAPAPVAAAFSEKGPAMRDRKRNFRRSPREGRAKPEFDQKIITIRRVARVAAGGRRFNFSVAMVIGNRRGSVGVGTGKGGDTAIAIEKSVRDARKNMVAIKLTKTMSVLHDVSAKYSSARLVIMPAKGRGVVAGSAARTVIELGGIKDVSVKIISPSKNQLNIARATVEALKKLKSGGAVKEEKIVTETK